MLWLVLCFEPVTLKVLDKEDVIIVCSCIPGSEAMDTCFWLSNVMYSYTCRHNQIINIYKKRGPSILKEIIYSSPLISFMLHMYKQVSSYFICYNQAIPSATNFSNNFKLSSGENFARWVVRTVPFISEHF